VEFDNRGVTTMKKTLSILLSFLLLTNSAFADTTTIKANVNKKASITLNGATPTVDLAMNETTGISPSNTDLAVSGLTVDIFTNSNAGATITLTTLNKLTNTGTAPSGFTNEVVVNKIKVGSYEFVSSGATQLTGGVKKETGLAVKLDVNASANSLIEGEYSMPVELTIAAN
jgi:hypothetical protein